MHRAVRLAIPCLLLVGLSCRSSGPTPAPAPAPAAPGTGAAAPRGEEGPPRGRGEFPGGFRRRVPLTPEQRAARRDSIHADRQHLADSLMATIAGRENEPAGKVFKNVKLLKDMPAGKFIETMNDDYAKAIGRSCSFCHERDDFASDERKEKHTTHSCRRSRGRDAVRKGTAGRVCARRFRVSGSAEPSIPRCRAPATRERRPAPLRAPARPRPWP
jgi:hypothetical protein